MRRIAVALTAPLLVLWPGSAHAEEQIGLSRTGTSWSATLTSPLFDSGFRWVPGDRQTESFFVRNQAVEAGTLAVTATRVPGSPDLRVQMRVAGGAWRTLDESTTVEGGTLAAGQNAKIDVNVTFDTNSTNASQRETFPAKFEVTLTQSEASHHPGDGDNPPDNPPNNPADNGPDNADNSDDQASGSEGHLPFTGADIDPLLPLLALAALGTGGVLLIAARRRTTKENPHE